MSTLVYTPGVKMHIETTTDGIIDLSDDLVSGQIMLRENAPHTVQFVLQNAQRKYDGRILPMDKISVQLKRLNWLQCMTGYMNDPPIFQAFPGTLQMSATCTLKVPQFFSTDTTTSAFQSMVMAAMSDNLDERGVMGDSGLSRLIVDAMTKVIGWEKGRIHIGEVPNNWFKFAQPIIKEIQADEAIYKAIGPDYTAAGSYNGVTTTLQPGKFANRTLDATQAKNLSVVVSTALSSGNPDYVAIMCVMCVLVESEGGYNFANAKVPGSLALPHDRVGSNGLSVGLYQQQVGPGFSWGPVGMCQDPASATQTFIKRLVKKLPEARSLFEAMYGEIVQSVQGSAFPDRYQTQLDAAKQIVAQAKAIAKKTTGGSATIGGGVVTDPAAGYKATGSRVAKAGFDLIAGHKTSPIHYRLSGDDSYDTPAADVKTLDCSSFIDWTYYNSTGVAFKKPRAVVGDYFAECTLIPLSAAKSIQGAVLIHGPNEHIALSLGNGSTCAAAKTDGVPLAQQVVNDDPIDPNGFTTGGLLPGVDYSSSATTKAAQNALTQAGIKVKGLAPQLTSVNDPSVTSATQDGADGSPFASLVNSIIVNADTDTQLIGNAIGGKAALINDQYILPWLQAVVNASMRSFCSAPNGDFIAWFPDYFGSWGTAGIINIERIELQNFQVNWSDQTLVTHQFVLGNLGASLLDPTTGAVGTNSPVNDLVSLATGTAGIASLDFPEIFNVIYGETAPSGFTKAFLKRFGARPDVQQLPNVPHGAAEFFMALYLFIQRWAGQFSASVPMTFMPELFPGMLLRVPEYGFQCYVQGVTHSFQFGDGGGFTTSADICAPSNLAKSDRTDLLSLLPLGGRKVT